MSAAPRIPQLPLSDTLAKLALARPSQGVYPMDAALAQRGPERYATRREGFQAVIATWLAVIAGERLSDVTISDPFSLAVDFRDGALTRGGGGLAYTPHAWSQMIAAFKVGKSPIPDGIAGIARWLSPLTRHHAFEDIKRASKRVRTEELVLRCFLTTYEGKAYPAIRAVVTGRHGLKDTDDSTVIDVLKELDEMPTEGRVSRGWDKTYGSFVFDSGDADVRLGFAFTNSETGCGSLAFNGSILIRALDAEVTMPSGAQFENMVTIATSANATKRRHTLPRYDSRSGRRLTDGQRTAIAQSRIGEDVDRALSGARVLAQRWGVARTEINPMAVQLASIAVADDLAVGVLRDFFIDAGLAKVVETLGGDSGLKGLAEVIASEVRLRSIPHGSAAHMAAALALLASRGTNWEQVRELQDLSGRFVMEGWPR